MRKSLLLSKTKDLLKGSSNTESSVSCFDVDYQVIEDPSNPYTTDTRGTTVLYDYDAILNAVRMWLQSEPYDYIDEPEIGGVVKKLIGSNEIPMTSSGANTIAESIKEGIKNTWGDSINVVSVIATPNRNEKNWKIKVTVSDPQSGLMGSFQDTLSSE